MVYGAFSPSVLGMMSQSHALNTIGANIANVNTGGYKGSDTRFSSLVSDSLYHESDLSGIRPWDFQRIDQQGLLQASASQMDLGINGRGFFVLSDSFDGSGHTFYGRDGAFQMRTVNDVAVTADDGSTITVKDGYLADKNGYFVLGWEPNADGTYPSDKGSLTPLRIDPYAFSERFEPTTSVVLGLNLPSYAPTSDTQNYSAGLIDSAGNLQTVTYSFFKSHVANQWLVVPKTDGTGTTQVDTVTLAGTPEVGDIYSTTINGSSFSHKVQGVQEDSVTLSGTAEAGDTYTVTVDGTPVSYTASQNDTVTLSGTVEVGDTYSITINGTPFTYTALGGETLSDIRDDLLNQITLSGLPVTASASGADGIAVQGTAAFTLVASATNGGVTPDNTAATTSATDTLADIRDSLVTQINTIPGAAVTAVANGIDGITVTANVANTPFTLVANAVDGGGTPDNAVALATTSTPETLAVVRDDLLAQINGSTLSAKLVATANGTDGITVTANAADDPFALTALAVDLGGTADNTATTTTTATVLTFDSKGVLTSPATAALAVSFAGGTTASVDVDLTDMTQFAGDLLPLTYSRDGYAAADMEAFRFDESGNVIGSFGDGSTRVVYRVPLAVFSNPNGLEEKNGNVFSTTTESGEPDVVTAFSNGAGSFMPSSRELSNVDIATEFSTMIMTQNAYNSSAQIFKTIDEMIQVARDLKR